jgi:hypothetical protein
MSTAFSSVQPESKIDYSVKLLMMQLLGETILNLDQWIRRKMNQLALTPMSGSLNLANHNHGLRQIAMTSRVELASRWLILVRYKL